MDLSVKKSGSNAGRPGPVVMACYSVLDFVRRLIGFFMLIEEDRRKAGIYRGGEGRDG